MATTIVKRKHVGTTSAAAGTAFVATLPGQTGLYTRLAFARYTNGNTNHTLSVMRPLAAGTTLAAAMNAATNSVTYSAEFGPTGNTIANNDWASIKLSDGTWHTGLVSALNTTLKTFTISGSLAAAAANGAKVVMLGLPADTGNFQTALLGTAQAHTIQDGEGVVGVFGADRADEPLVLHSDNATGTGTLNGATAIYVREGL